MIQWHIIRDVQIPPSRDYNWMDILYKTWSSIIAPCQNRCFLIIVDILFIKIEPPNFKQIKIGIELFIFVKNKCDIANIFLTTILWKIPILYLKITFLWSSVRDFWKEKHGVWIWILSLKISDKKYVPSQGV